jgi:hypothetical protein
MATPMATTVKVEGTTVLLPPVGCHKENVRFHCVHRVCLTKEEEWARVVPRDNDLLGIRVDADGVESSPELRGMSLQIGARVCLYWDRKTLLSGEELLGRALSEEPNGPSAPTPVVPISRSLYHHTDLVFHYDSDTLVSRAKFKTVAVDEFRDVEDYGQCQFRDSITGEVRWGTMVIRRDRDKEGVKTVTIVTEGTEVCFPGFSISSAPNFWEKFDQKRGRGDPGDKIVSVPFWQRTEPVPSEENRAKWGLRVLQDGTTYARNELRFSEGMAGLAKFWETPKEWGRL